MRSLTISLIGRPNVGKSTIFNRLLRNATKALAHDLPGVTRDRCYAIGTVDELPNTSAKDFILVDTGGFYPEKIREVISQKKRKFQTDPFFNEMAEHAKVAIDESDLVLFVVDVREGLIPYDQAILNYIRSTQKDCWVLVNKYDDDSLAGMESDFYQLGLKRDDLLLISAEHGRGLTDLRERIHAKTLAFEKDEFNSDHLQKGIIPRHDVVGNVAIIGAPNVGKSTLLNRLVGASRALVSPRAGTTIDPIEAYIDLDFANKAHLLKEQQDQFRISDRELLDILKTQQEEDPDKYLIPFHQLETASVRAGDIDTTEELTELEMDESDSGVRSVKIVDTAGIRKSKLVKGFIETQSVYRSLRAITEADVVIILVDATKGITHQDRRLADISLDKGKSLIVCINKVDLIADTLKTQRAKKEWLQDLQAQIPWLSFCEIIFISAKEGSYVKNLQKALAKTLLIRSRAIGTAALNRCISELTERNPIMLSPHTGTRLKIKYAAMVKAAPPTFLLFSNKSKGIPENYRKYLQNGIRKEFQLVNTPVHLLFRTTGDIERRAKRELTTK